MRSPVKPINSNTLDERNFVPLALPTTPSWRVLRVLDRADDCQMRFATPGAFATLLAMKHEGLLRTKPCWSTSPKLARNRIDGILRGASRFIRIM